jgi:SAM-dependent methyltransferase
LTNRNFTDEHYERAWSQIALSISPQDEERIKQTLSLIPKDCSSIIDVGCGDGRITNRLISRYSKVVGLDRSREALKYVNSGKVLGSVDSLPFPNKSFDLVLCCEVLEHLPFRVYPRAIEEMERVAARYILVTVPNKEDLKRLLVTCPYCGCRFNSSRHVRSFNTKRLKDLFGQFDLQALQSCPLGKAYPSLLIKCAKFVGFFPELSFPATALCPQCGYSIISSRETTPRASIRDKSSTSAWLLSLARRLPTGKRGGCIMALYYRRRERL